MSAHYDAQYQKKNIIIIIDSQYDSIFDNYNALHTHTHKCIYIWKFVLPSLFAYFH